MEFHPLGFELSASFIKSNISILFCPIRPALQIIVSEPQVLLHKLDQLSFQRIHGSFSVRTGFFPFPLEKVAHSPVLAFFCLSTAVSRNFKVAQRPAPSDHHGVAFFEMTDVHQCSYVDFHFLFLCFKNDSNLHAGNCPSFFILYQLLLSHPQFYRLKHRNKFCAPNCCDLSNWTLSPRCDLHDLLVESITNALSWIHEPPRCMHAFVFWTVLESWISSSATGDLLERFFRSHLTEHDRLHCHLQLFPCVC